MMIDSVRRTRAIAWLFLIVLLVACVPAESEPSLGGPITVTVQLSPTETVLPTPFPSPTAVLSPTLIPSITATSWEQEWVTPSATVDGQGLPPVITPTPVPPPPGLVYSLDGQLWQVGEDWQPVALAAEPGDVLSRDGTQALRVVEGDIWLISLPTGQRFNLTGNSGRVHCCPQFWPERPGTIIAGSWPTADDIGPSTGHLTAANVDLGEYRVLDEKHLSNANAAPGPDGKTIAYDRGGSSWFYDWQDGPRSLDPADYGLDNVARIAGPSWSPDGRQLAWTVAVTGGGWRIAVAVFDLAAGTARLFHPYENVGRGGWFGPPAWSPDGRWLTFVTEDVDPAVRGVYVIDVGTGDEIFAGAGVKPIWSPDGRWLLVNPMDANESGAWLVEAATWYPLQMYLPPGAQVVDWLP